MGRLRQSRRTRSSCGIYKNELKLRSVQLKEEVRGCWCLRGDASVLTVNADGRIVLWSLPDFEVLAELASDIRVMCGDLSPSTREVVLGSENGTLHFVGIDPSEDLAARGDAHSAVQTQERRHHSLSGQAENRALLSVQLSRLRPHRGDRRLPSEAIPCPSCNRLLHIARGNARVAAAVIDGALMGFRLIGRFAFPSRSAAEDSVRAGQRQSRDERRFQRQRAQVFRLQVVHVALAAGPRQDLNLDAVACSQLATRSAAASISSRFINSGSCVVMPTGQRPVWQ